MSLRSRYYVTPSELDMILHTKFNIKLESAEAQTIQPQNKPGHLLSSFKRNERASTLHTDARAVFLLLKY